MTKGTSSSNSYWKLLYKSYKRPRAQVFLNSRVSLVVQVLYRRETGCRPTIGLRSSEVIRITVLSVNDRRRVLPQDIPVLVIRDWVKV